MHDHHSFFVRVLLPPEKNARMLGLQPHLQTEHLDLRSSFHHHSLLYLLPAVRSRAIHLHDSLSGLLHNLPHHLAFDPSDNNRRNPSVCMQEGVLEDREHNIFLTLIFHINSNFEKYYLKGRQLSWVLSIVIIVLLLCIIIRWWFFILKFTIANTIIIVNYCKHGNSFV